MGTTIQVSEAFADRVADMKQRGESYEDVLRRELGWQRNGDGDDA